LVTAQVVQESMWQCAMSHLSALLVKECLMGNPHAIFYWCRLKAEQMEAVFERKKRLLPRPTDLSFYNWDTQVSMSNATANFQVSTIMNTLHDFVPAWPDAVVLLHVTAGHAMRVKQRSWHFSRSSKNCLMLQVIAENEKGLLFKNKRDRKVINVDPKAVPGDNSTRTELQTEEYIQAVIYDHVTRRRAWYVQLKSAGTLLVLCLNIV